MMAVCYNVVADLTIILGYHCGMDGMVYCRQILGMAAVDQLLNHEDDLVAYMVNRSYVM